MINKKGSDNQHSGEVVTVCWSSGDRIVETIGETIGDNREVQNRAGIDVGLYLFDESPGNIRDKVSGKAGKPKGELCRNDTVIVEARRLHMLDDGLGDDEDEYAWRRFTDGDMCNERLNSKREHVNIEAAFQGSKKQMSRGRDVPVRQILNDRLESDSRQGVEKYGN